MNREEFNEWVTYHATRFPSLAAKFAERPDTISTWVSRFEGITLAAAKGITDDMQAGEIDHPHSLDWDRLPAVVLAEADARAKVRARPVGGYVDTPGPRYRCKKCHDTGLVSVWSFYSVRVFLNAPSPGMKITGTIDDAKNRRSMVCACDCQQGDKHVQDGLRNDEEKKRWKGWTDHAFRFSTELYAELCESHNIDSQASRTNLEDFCERLKLGQTRHRYNGMLACHEVEPAFSDHNRGL